MSKFQHLQSLHPKYHMLFWYQENAYLVHEIGDDFIVGTAANGEHVKITDPDLARFFVFDGDWFGFQPRGDL